MQTINDGEVDELFTGEASELSDKLTEKMENGEADGGIIANLPEADQEVEINGLKFNVQQVTKSGNVILEPKGLKT
ncbi:hypothetical protein [Fodinibius sp.]|uniref:hypothetical protein n=1 Tax=Fodinibius sp. TaxID=1872440 RepID=UPI002ACE32CC|nr:hypothetical protein [Fodinibius sp.]MDZ7658038.1 hypothetical protein [Fodinibius sp.]